MSMRKGRKLVRSKTFCSSFLPYHIFSFFHVLHCLRIHSFFEYNKSLCENVGSARSVDRNSKTIIIIIIIIINKALRTHRSSKHPITNLLHSSKKFDGVGRTAKRSWQLVTCSSVTPAGLLCAGTHKKHRKQQRQQC